MSGTILVVLVLIYFNTSAIRWRQEAAAKRAEERRKLAEQRRVAAENARILRAA